MGRAAVSLCLACSAWSVGLCGVDVARADDCVADSQSVEEARRLFDAGNEAANREQLALAATCFEASLGAHPDPGTAFNLAHTLGGQGRLLAAEDTLLDALRGAFGTIRNEDEPRFTELLDEVREGIAVLRLNITGAERASVRIDGEAAGVVTGAAPLEVRLDPGQHLMVARTSDGRSIERDLRMARGDHEQSELQFETGESTTTTSSAEITGGGDEVGWWILFSALGAALVAGVTIAIVVAVQPERVTDPVWGNVVLERF